jgi:hypothetical protein
MKNGGGEVVRASQLCGNHEAVSVLLKIEAYTCDLDHMNATFQSRCTHGMKNWRTDFFQKASINCLLDCLKGPTSTPFNLVGIIP